MSDTMLFGVLRMPYELAMSSELSRVQFYGRAQEAANLIESQAAELELRRKSGTASDRLHNLCEGIAADADGSEWSREEWERIDAETVRLKNEIESQSAELARITAERDAAKAAYEITRQDCWNLTEKVIPNLRAENDALRAALADLLDAHARNVLYNGAGHWDAARAALQPIAPQDDKADDARAHFDRLDRMAQQEWAEVMDTRRRLEAAAMDAAKEQGS